MDSLLNAMLMLSCRGLRAGVAGYSARRYGGYGGILESRKKEERGMQYHVIYWSKSVMK